MGSRNNRLAVCIRGFRIFYGDHVGAAVWALVRTSH